MIEIEKKELRKKIKELKKNYSIEEKKSKSRKIFEKIEVLPEFITSNTIMAYWSMDDEVYTHDFILKWQDKKRFILPSVKGEELELREFTGIKNMIKGSVYSISEPIELFKEKINKIELVIVPGVAFDKQNNRLGRGKAYYDKLLKDSNAFKIGVCFDFQLINLVPISNTDIRMDRVIND